MSVLKQYDRIIVMEYWMFCTIVGEFPEIPEEKIKVLNIPDEYQFMSKNLINKLVEKIMPTLTILDDF